MSSAPTKPVCKYGSSCYRKNPDHLRTYFHPEHLGTQKIQKDTSPVDDKENLASEPPCKRARLTDTRSESPEPNVKINTAESVVDGASNTLKPTAEIKNSTAKGCDDISDTIHKLFLVKMPNDFYQFWEFCKEICPKNPSDVLKPLGLSLTGPYDVLGDKLDTSHLSWEDCILHGRHFFDPPELQTVIMDNEDDGFHIGYFRDDPKSDMCTVVSNTVSNGCTVKVLGSNIFSAVKSLLTKKSIVNKELRDLDDNLTNKAEALGIHLKNDKGIKRSVVSKCFNQIGISVPIDEENDIGYRPLTMTNRELKSVLDKITKHSTEAARDSLQELITFVQFANDECDYGMGLELGIDLFCYGDPLFHGKIQHLLSLAYDLLDRPEYGKIIQQHLEHRQKPKFMLKVK